MQLSSSGKFASGSNPGCGIWDDFWPDDDGAPIERALLQSQVDSLAYRGPDSQTCWLESSIGLGHAMLRTTQEAAGENQPAFIDRRPRIVAHAPIACREDLTGDLQRYLRKGGSTTPD